MHGHPQSHSPLHAAARETMAVARKAGSPIFERAAMITMIASALITTALAAVQAWPWHTGLAKYGPRPKARGVFETTPGGASGTGRCLKVSVEGLSGWNTYASPKLPDLFR